MLTDVSILDFSHLLPGQLASSFLGQLGAEVIMVETPEGHRSREYPHSFSMYNHGKQNIAIDLKTPSGKEVCLELAREVDVIIEQFRPGVIDRLGVGYDDVRTRNPEVVYCSISGFGQDGPRRNHVGHDLNFAGLTGLVDLTGRPGEPPVEIGTPVVDFGTAMTAALSISGALYDGTGRYIDISMLDVATTFMMPNLAEYLGRNATPTRGETLYSGGYPSYALYECRNGEYLTVAATEPAFWTRLCRGLGLEEYEDEQWAAPPKRREIFDAFRARFAELPRTDWLAAFDASEIPVAPVQSVEEVVDMDQLVHRGTIRQVPGSGEEQQFRTVRYPATFSGYSVPIAHAPSHGEHARPLLEICGYDDDEIEELIEEGAVIIAEEDDGI